MRVWALQMRRIWPRADRAQPGLGVGAEPGQRPDLAVGQGVGRVSPGLSQPLEGARSGPEDFSHLAESPGVEKRSEFPGYNPGVSSTPVQGRQRAGGGVELRVSPVLGDAGGNKEIQVELTLLNSPVDNLPPRRGTRIRRPPDKYQAGQ